MKPAGSLIASVVLGGLVFLSATWTVYRWAATKWLEHRKKDAMYCQGCIYILQQGFIAGEYQENGGLSQLQLSLLPGRCKQQLNQEDTDSLLVNEGAEDVEAGRGA